MGPTEVGKFSDNSSSQAMREMGWQLGGLEGGAKKCLTKTKAKLDEPPQNQSLHQNVV